MYSCSLKKFFIDTYMYIYREDFTVSIFYNIIMTKMYYVILME